MSGALVGPLSRVWYAGETAPRYYELPRNTLDIRYTACPDHHLACDCREAMLAETISEYRGELACIEKAIISATADHQVWGYDGTGWEDEFSACKCQLCVIRRDCFIGYGEFIQARREATARLEAEARRRDRRYYDLDEVPF